MRLLLALILVIYSTQLHAQGNDAVMEAYKNYTDAVESGNKRDARRYAQEAYELAEQQWGDTRKETALLATNYADQLTQSQEWRNAINLYDRCVEILGKFENTLKETIYCRSGAADAYQVGGKTDEARVIYYEIVHTLEGIVESEQWAAAAVGKAYLRLATIVNRSESQPIPRGTIFSGETSSRISPEEPTVETPQTGRQFAEKAVHYFGIAFDEPTIESAQAHRIAGNYAEQDEDYDIAEKHYRAAYEILKKTLREEDEATMQMSGRVAYMELFTKYILETPIPSRQPSSDNCYVIVRGDLEIEYCTDLRIAPKFPNTALFKGQQGFVYVEYDINKEGRVENAHIVHSWPGGVFDERALKMVRTWKFFPPTDQYDNVVAAKEVRTLFKFLIR